MSIRKPIALAASALLILGLGACSSDDAQGASQAQSTTQAGGPSGAVTHGQLVSAEQVMGLPDGLSGHELPDGRFVVIERDQPLPQEVLDHLRGLVDVDPPASLEDGTLGSATMEAAEISNRLARDTGRVPAFVHNVGFFDGAGTLKGEMWMVEAGGEAGQNLSQMIAEGEYVQMTYPTYEEAITELRARVEATSDPSVYELIELDR